VADNPAWRCPETRCSCCVHQRGGCWDIPQSIPATCCLVSGLANMDCESSPRQSPTPNCLRGCSTPTERGD